MHMREAEEVGHDFNWSALPIDYSMRPRNLVNPLS